MSEIGDFNWFPGTQMRRDANKIEISQESNIEKLLGNFGMSDAKTAFTPALEKVPISSVDCPSKGGKEEKEMCCNYRGSIGSLNYLANTSRPDIPFVVRSLSRFVHNPVRQHWNQVKHVLRFLKAMKVRKLIYKKADQIRVVGYSDADCAGKRDSKKSTGGYCFSLNETSGAISWNTKLQTTVATSTADAETAALFAVTQGLIFLRELGAELGMSKSLPSSVFVDNQAWIAMIKDTVCNGCLIPSIDKVLRRPEFGARHCGSLPNTGCFLD